MLYMMQHLVGRYSTFACDRHLRSVYTYGILTSCSKTLVGSYNSGYHVAVRLD